MPIYDYKCLHCNIIFDKLISASKRNEEQNCPQCDKPAKRKMSLIARPKGSSSACSDCSSTNCSTCSSASAPST